MQAQRVVVVSAAGAGMLGTFLPWVSLGPLSVDGTRGDGWITLGLFAIAMMVALVGNRGDALSNRARFAIIVVAMLAAITGLYDFSGAHDLALAAVGPGIYLVILAALVIVVTVSMGDSRLPVMLAIAVTAIVVMAGFIHVPYGANAAEIKACSKLGWSLQETFVDVDDFVGKRLTIANAKVVNALVGCGVLTKSAPAPQPQVPQASAPGGPAVRARTYGACRGAEGKLGVCMDVDECQGLHQPGLCLGADNIQCCFPD